MLAQHNCKTALFVLGAACVLHNVVSKVHNAQLLGPAKEGEEAILALGRSGGIFRFKSERR